MTIDIGAAGLLGLFTHFLVLSLLAVGGAITTAPDMHRYLVTEQHWLSDAQFTSSIAIAQAAPGPNVLFVADVARSAAGFRANSSFPVRMSQPATCAVSSVHAIAAIKVLSTDRATRPIIISGTNFDCFLKMMKRKHSKINSIEYLKYVHLYTKRCK